MTGPNSPKRIARREFLRGGGVGLGSIALYHLLGSGAARAGEARAKNVIFLFMAGGPSQFELFEPKETLQRLNGKTPPAENTNGKRFAFIDPSRARLLGTAREFTRHGASGAPVSELLPHTARVVDELCFVRGLTTNEINHGPAKLFMNTGFGRFGRPSMGAWITYGIGSEAADLPGFIVLQSGSRGPRGGAPLWGHGFLPPHYQGTPFRSGPEPVLHLSTPPGVGKESQEDFFETVATLDRLQVGEVDEAAIQSRIASYEMAFRMQASSPELIDLSKETQETRALYGVLDDGPSFARNCLLARRMVERGVRFVQLYHADWDHHGDPDNNLGKPLEDRCREVDQASAALVRDLKRRGLLDDTLVIWGGEFGRTPMGEVRLAVGRDHHIDAFTMWMAGGGIKAGFSYGVTDDIGYSVVEEGLDVHDLHATILHLLGIDHTKLTHRFQGRDFRLTDVHGRVVHELLA